jgi:tetratricopeptide (TPR) repeat protein
MTSAEVPRLDAEIAEHERLLADATLTADQRAALLNDMAIRLRVRARHTGEPSDLARALRASQAAVDGRDPAAGHASRYMTTLANCLIDRYALTGSDADLDAAVAAYQRAVDEAGECDDRGVYEANLASALDDRFRHSGRLADLNMAITMVEQIPVLPDPLEQAGLAANHASMLLNRYAATGQLDDLEQAVTVTRAALGQAPGGTLTRTALRINLGGALQSMYDRTRRPGDLEDALHQLQLGLSELQADAPDRAPMSNNLGIAYAAQARANSGEDRRRDLDLAIAAHRVAVAGAGRRERLGYLNDLGGALLDRFQETGRRKDLRTAVRIWRSVVARTPVTAPVYARRAGNLARAMAMSSEVSGSRLSLARARARWLYARSCAVGLDADPEAALSNASDWGAWASRRMAWAEAAGAYESAWVAIERLVAGQLLRSHKEAWLATATGVAADAALAHARTGEQQAAARALERGRALLLSDALAQGRTDLQRLRERDRADLVERFQAASAQLTAVATQRWTGS